jgi:nucleoside-diphosphate-sugar epimerase
LLNLDKIREAVAPGWECSDEKLRRLGYQPGASLEDRFAETAAWYRAQGWL